MTEVVRRCADQPIVSVCIVNWNTCELLRGCLTSILNSTNGLPVEIFVIDNNSKDHSAAMVQTEFSTVHLISNDTNLGFGQANNQAIKHSHAPYILILNPDTVVLQDSLSTMVDFLEQTPDAGAIGCQLLNRDRTLQYSLRTFPTIFTPFTENSDINWLPLVRSLYNRYRLYNWSHDSVIEVDQPMGAAMMVRRSVIETIGAFDEDYHMFFEDVDLCYRIKRNGWKIFYIPYAQIVHYGGCSVRQREKIGEEFYASLLKYFWKNHRKRVSYGVRSFMVGFGFTLLFSTLFLAVLRPRRWLDLVKAGLQIIRYGFSHSIPKDTFIRFIP